jgi:hypothetical protein
MGCGLVQTACHRKPAGRQQVFEGKKLVLYTGMDVEANQYTKEFTKYHLLRQVFRSVAESAG